MSNDLLQTKLYVPRLRPFLVPRPHLTQKLSYSLEQGSKLTLISAPAGFGKTTLITEWIAGGKRPFTWLSLDERDSDLTRFLTYFVAALQKISPTFGKQLLGVLESAQLPPIESILTALLNEITALPEAFILVLDDYHAVDEAQIDGTLAFLLEHLPPQMHLVITTREDPNLPLARWRVRSQLTELRANDLRFSVAETAVFLKQVMGLNLTEDNIARLEARTEGWIAGLQLAALSMQGRDDISGFLQAFTGDNRYIVDYLVEEVLQRQPEPTRHFLLQTAILERLNGPLCTAVTGQPESKARLESLERGNFFLIPLDDKRQWYRYHHLFAEVLNVHLMAEQPQQVATLHRRASEWYENNGSLADAIRHALTGTDFERAASLIERSVPEMGQTRQESTLLGWFQALPEKLLQDRPVLSVHYAGALLQNGHLDGVESLLRNAQRWLDNPTDIRKQPIYGDEEGFQRLPGSVAMYQAGIALMQGDVVNTIRYAQQVLEIAPEDDNFLYGAASSLLGLAFWTSADLEKAYQMFADGMAYLQRAGFISDVVGGSVTLADIRIAQGRLREAMSIYKHGLQLATKQGRPALRGAADMHVGMSEIYRDQNDLSAARQHLLKSQELGELNGLPKNPFRWRVALARIREAEGDLEGAFDLLEEAAPLYVSDFSPNFRPIQALKTRVRIAQGRLDEALSWARQQGVSVEDDLSYLREFEHITLARLLLAQRGNGRNQNTLHKATALLDRLLKFAEEGGRIGVVIEILILLALAHQLQTDTPTALGLLERALKLAEPEGYVRTFLDEGPPMMELLHEAAIHGIMPGYTQKLLEAFTKEHFSSESNPAAPQPLIEPLSQRELDILRLFPTELSGPEIADELVIALSTVRTHTKGIYSKLNVNSRRAAVKRAIELGLI
ncbi:MAG: helix-turn-helix transcriptional regulator [Ardenticatenaceae bacterium]|nr:helix-turn-helix transcriptional regulator [Ardenticatenaceae bacterium]